MNLAVLKLMMDTEDEEKEVEQSQAIQIEATKNAPEMDGVAREVHTASISVAWQLYFRVLRLMNIV
jgi:hypothetical protein